MQIIRKVGTSVFLIIILSLSLSCGMRDGKEHDSGCRHNLKEVAFSILLYKTELNDYPKTLEQMNEFLIKQLGDVENSIYCPVNGDKSKFTYHKPPPDASPEFIFLECPNHPKEFKYRLKNIGIEN